MSFPLCFTTATIEEPDYLDNPCSEQNRTIYAASLSPSLNHFLYLQVHLFTFIPFTVTVTDLSLFPSCFPSPNHFLYLHVFRQLFLLFPSCFLSLNHFLYLYVFRHLPFDEKHRQNIKNTMRKYSRQSQRLRKWVFSNKLLSEKDI